MKAHKFYVFLVCQRSFLDFLHTKSFFFIREHCEDVKRRVLLEEWHLVELFKAQTNDYEIYSAFFIKSEHIKSNGEFMGGI